MSPITASKTHAARRLPFKRKWPASRRRHTAPRASSEDSSDRAGVGVPGTVRTDNPALQKQLLDQRATQFRRSVLVEGKNEENELALILGYDSVSLMKTKLGAEMIDKSIKRLLEQAEEIEREKDARNELFKNGKLYYERGMYKEAVAALEQALVREGALSPLGGEIQMWLALGYSAVGNEAKCLEVYKYLENNHPVPAIRKQAASLRYIMEAPKIALRPEEKVSIPVMDDVDKNLGRSGKDRPTRPRTNRQPRKKRELTLEEQFWEEYRPPNALKNKYVWAATGAVIVLAWWSLENP